MPPRRTGEASGGMAARSLVGEGLRAHCHPGAASCSIRPRDTSNLGTPQRSERGAGPGRPWLAPPGLDRSGSRSRRKHSGAPATPMGTHVAGLAGPSMASSLGPDRRLVRCPPTYISVGGVFIGEDFPASRAKTLGAERDVTAPALCQQRRPRDAPRVERPGAVAALRSSKGQRDTFPRTALHRERSALV